MNLRLSGPIPILGLCAFACLTPGQQPSSETDVVKISTSLVRIDVTATDKDGKTVRGLTPNDFKVYENGNQQKIVSLTYVPPGATRQPTTTAPSAETRTTASDPTDRPMASPTPVVTRRLVVAIDDYTLSAESVESTRKALRKYIEANFRPGDAIAIVPLSKVKAPIVRFYLKRELLDEAVNSIGWYSGGIGEAAAIPPTDPDLKTGLGRNFSSAWAAEEVIARLRVLLAAIKVVPGRVPVVLFSDGFELPPAGALVEASRDQVLQPLLKLIDTANRQATSFYTIDARGLVVFGLRASDTMPSNDSASSQAALQSYLALRKQRMDQVNKPQDTLNLLAQQTGGIAYRNRNDLGTALEEAADDGGYYLLAYEPSAEDFDPKTLKMNKIHLETRRKGVELRYRTSFASHQ